MSDVKITVGGAMEDQAARRFVDAWHRAKRGDSFAITAMSMRMSKP